ncbi:MAG: MarR family winged helix-turn-helix transcriptional regulator [Muribaculaceae bacterium]|nr:MarR family winged helix-turn-helix transcriptional regulator [Muribaculaceae bacterium]
MEDKNIYGSPYLGCLVGAAYQKMTSELEIALKRENLSITAAEYMILRALYSHDQLQQCEICEMVGKDKASISRSVSVLKKKGLVKTEIVSYKCIRVSTTDKAKEIEPLIMKVAYERHQALLSLASEKDIYVFTKILKSIIEE